MLCKALTRVWSKSYFHVNPLFGGNKPICKVGQCAPFCRFRPLYRGTIYTRFQLTRDNVMFPTCWGNYWGTFSCAFHLQTPATWICVTDPTRAQVLWDSLFLVSFSLPHDLLCNMANLGEGETEVQRTGQDNRKESVLLRHNTSLQ